MKKAGKWDGVFDAHPEVDQIFIGTNEQGSEQPFTKSGDALNFAGGNQEMVKPVKRTPKSKPADSTDPTGSGVPKKPPKKVAPPKKAAPPKKKAAPKKAAQANAGTPAVNAGEGVPPTGEE